MTCTVMGRRQGFVVLDSRASIGTLVECFWSSGAEHAALVDDDWRLVGVVSVRDLAALVADALELQGLVETSRFEGVLSTTVEEVSSKPFALRGSVSLEAAVCAMAEHGIGFIPVIDDEGKLVEGYVEVDVADRLVGLREPALSYATRRIIYLEAGAPLVEALGLMRAYRVRRIPVPTGTGVKIAYINDLLYFVLRGRSLHTPLERLGLPNAVVAESSISLGDAAFHIARVRYRALLLGRNTVLDGIITERDLVRAYSLKLAC